MQKSRCITPMGISLVAPVALGVGLFHKTDKNSPKADTKTNKTLDFIAKHAGLLTLASYFPMVAEEGLASIRGINLAKKHYINKEINNNPKYYAKGRGIDIKTIERITSSIDEFTTTATSLTKDLAITKLKCNYITAWSTYALAAALVAGGVALGVACANKIKNKNN